MAFDQQLDEPVLRKFGNRVMVGPEKIRRQHERSPMTARARINTPLDHGSVLEIGRCNHSDMPDMNDQSPADSKVANHKRVGAKVMNLMSALGMLADPETLVTVRKSCDMVFWRKCGTGFIVAWLSVNMGFVDAPMAANVVFGGQSQAVVRQSPQWQTNDAAVGG